MTYQKIFKRYEIKYLLTQNQVKDLKEIMDKYMVIDQYGNNTICNIYLDTPDYLLIRRSLDKPIYKEKLRFRSYGIAQDNSEVFCELKKKYNSIVYKRRIAMREKNLCECVVGKSSFPNTQIGKEINFCFSRYSKLEPKIFLSYEREAFYGKYDESFRMTFDKNILWRNYDLSLKKGIYGNPILDKNKVLLEIKTIGAIPLWLVRFLSENGIYKTTFSKYGNAYKNLLITTKTGGNTNVGKNF